ncbi:MAG TPA: hypothetical protein DCE25_06800 [Pseudomonas sp.]|nr:hypothetical protein [Pseudomonas sp.]
MNIDKQKLKALAEATDDCENEQAWDQFMEATSPATILALLAEIEQAWREAGNECRDWAREVERRQEVQRERDQLKAENEALRDGANFRAIQSLRADCEALRKDAARYRWLREPWQDQRRVRAWTSLEVMDENIDAAMAKEANQ